LIEKTEATHPLDWSPLVPLAALQDFDVRTENLTILFVDIAGYTATTNRQSRQQNAFLLERFVSLLKPCIRQFSGQIVKSMGDALLLTFRSPTNAMLCAQQLHDRLALYHQLQPEQEEIVIRVAAHLGEVRITRNDVFGEAVNLAARIEAATPAGEIYLSEAVYLAMNKAEVLVESAGQFSLDGFEHPLHLYRVCKIADAELPYGSVFSTAQKKHRWAPWLIATLMAAASGFWLFKPTVEPTLLAPPRVDIPDAKFVQVKWKSTPQTVPAALRFEINQLVAAVIAPVTNLYVFENGSAAAQIQTLEFATRHVAANDSVALKVRLLDAKGTVLNQQELEWSNQPSYHQISALFPLLSQWFTSSAVQMPTSGITDSLYNQYLAMSYQLHQAKQLQNREQIQLASKGLQQLHEAAPTFLPAHLRACDALLLAAELEIQTLPPAALSVCDFNSIDEQARLLQARLAMLQARWNDAESLLREVLSNNSKSMEAYSLLASVYHNQKRPLEAELVLRQAINFQPRYWPALQQLAMYYFSDGQIRQAIPYLRLIVELTPNNADTLTNLGSAYLLVGDLQAAADIYQQAVTIEPTAMVQTNLASVYYYLGRFQQALDLYKAALLAEPTSAEINGNIADTYRQLGLTTDATLYYEKAISILEANNPRGRKLAYLAKFSYFAGRLEAGLKFAETAQQQNSQNSDVLLVRATLLTAEQQYDQAMVVLEKAIALGYPASLIAVDPDYQALTTRTDFRELVQTTREH
jgi:class 3 adenylate cyclase/tetratricopeptide (TPR) repeat protein